MSRGKTGFSSSVFDDESTKLGNVVELADTYSLGNVDLTDMDSFRNWLTSSDPYAGKYKTSSSILPWKRIAEESNSAIDFGIQSQQYQSELAKYFFELNYNSESSKIQRMRAAGINPDLQGLEQASEASGESFSQGLTENPQSDPAAEIGQVASICGSVINGTMAFMQNFQSLKAGSLANDMSEMNLNNDMMKFAKSYLANNQWFKEWLNSPMSDPKSPNYTPFLIGANASGSKYGKLIEDDIFKMYGRRNGRRFSQAVTQMSEQLQTKTDAQQFYNDYISAKGKFAGLGSDEDGLLQMIAVMNKAIYGADLAGRKASKTMSDYNNSYWSASDPYNAADAFNAGNEAMAQESRTNTALGMPMAEIAKSLWSDYKENGNTWSLVGLLFLNLGRMAIGNFGASYAPPQGQGGFSFGF